MKNKKILCTLLCVLMLVTLLSACDNVRPGGTTTGDVPGGTTTLPIEPILPVPDIPSNEKGYVVTFQDTPAATIESNLELGQRVEAGTVIKFSVQISDLFQGNIVVRANEQELNADNQGLYSITVQADTTITIEGLTLKESEMEGEGTSSNPFKVTSPVDMLYIAEQVNLGNATYAAGFYKLQNDLDFIGMEMAVIGDGNIDDAVFSGYFDGNGYTISNYHIETSSTRYVGLFGVLQADTTNGGGGCIYNLHLKNFTVSCDAAGKGCFIGSMVGYSMGGKLILCSAQDGQIDVYADNNSFSYAGGMVGIQQSLDYNSYAYYSMLSYCNTDVEINCNTGEVYAAGGISGYVSASSNGAVASLNNCYAIGDINGALRSGGLVGCMDSGSSVINSYAAGFVGAQSQFIDTVNFEDFCYAYAGGLVGYSEADTVISECFSASQLQSVASLGADYAVTGDILGCAADPGEFDYGMYPATVYNCYYVQGGKNDSVDLTSGDFIKEKLNWNPLDWKFEDGKYPVVNTKDNDDFIFNITISIDGEEFSFERDVYMMLQYWYQYEDGKLPSRLTAEDGSTRISYGYFFDEEHTMYVPDSFIPTHDVTLYAAVADVTEVAGEYEIEVDGVTDPIRLNLKTDGTFTYSDAGSDTLSGYIYDGKSIIFKDCRFGRYFSGDVELTQYQNYDFYAYVMEDGSLKIVGGVYEDSDNYDQETAIFTEDTPLMALPLRSALSGSYAAGNGVYTFYANGTALYKGANGSEELTYTRNGDNLQLIFDEKVYTGKVTADGITVDGIELKQLDQFNGSWCVDSKANKVYTFDGAGNWSYSYYGYKSTGIKTVYDRASGTYTIKNGVMSLSGDFNGTAVLKDGVLNITIDSKTVSCHRDGSFFGTWVYPDYGMTLYLNGLTADGQGTARVEYLYSNGTVEAYDLIYALDEKYSDRICLYYDLDVFGYLTYVPGNDLMNATIYVGSMGTFMSNVNMGAEDNYKGEWIGKIPGMEVLNFNGYGAYTVGVVTIGEDEISYMLDDATLSGAFVYNDKTYKIAYNEEDTTITVTVDGTSYTYYRRDFLADLTLTDGQGNLFTFDGRTPLGEQGVVYLNGNAAYNYAINGNTVEVYFNGKQIGSVVAGETAYELNLNDQKVELRIVSNYTGTWAMSGSPEGNLVIGTMGLDGKLSGNINGNDVTFVLQNDGVLKFSFDKLEYYVIAVGEDNLVLSLYKDWYLNSDPIACARIDEMYGVWTSKLNAVYKFDGMSASTLTNGLAQSGSVITGTYVGNTAFYYQKEGDTFILWTTNESGEVEIYRLNFCEVGTKGSFKNEAGTKAFVTEKGNSLFKVEAIDEDNDVIYTFDGFTKVTTSDGNEYSYKVVSVNSEDKIIEATITIGETERNVTIDYSETDVTITFED